MILPTACHVDPTPIGPAEVFFERSAAPGAHFDPFDESASTAKTSSTGRLIVVPTSNLAKRHDGAGRMDVIARSRSGASDLEKVAVRCR